ncbi:acetyl-CoA C-acyltransferase [bacterium]|nr:acetyl-CoA C-acyltransferase [bacterium]
MSEAFIVDAVRTPRGKRKGSLSYVHPIDLASLPLKALIERNKIDPKQIEDVIYGCVSQRNEQDNDIARGAVLAAGLPIEIPGVTLNRFCASGLTACNMAAQSVMAGSEDLVIGGGVEHMTKVPMDINFFCGDSGLMTHYPNLVPQGISAEMIAQKYGFTRTQLDEYAARSQDLAAKSWAEGRFKKSIIPVTAKKEDGSTFTFEKDEHFRPGTTVETLKNLKLAFKEDGVIHAGNSSGIVDGAAGVLFASKKKCDELGLKPRAKVVSMATYGSDPVIMLLGPIPSTRKALKKAGLTMKDIDLVEINEAFAPVVLACAKDLEIPLDRVNVNGGAIALGHPLGATGAMLVGTVLDELERQDKRYGLITLCIGMGMGVTTIIERL